MRIEIVAALILFFISANVSAQTSAPTDADKMNHSACADGLFPKGNLSHRTNEWAKSKAIRKLKHVDNKVPPEITRIKNGVVIVSAGIVPGVGIFMQEWYAYDDERHIFVSVVGKSYESVRPRPDLPLRNNQMDRYVRNGEKLHRAERITVFAANWKTVDRLSCIANKYIILSNGKGVMGGGNMPSADGWTYVNVVKGGIPIKKNSDDEQVRKSQDELMHILYSIFHSMN